MLKVLLKKQLMEVFRMYFYDAKKNKPRSKAGTALWFVFYAVLMLGVLGGMFTYLSVVLCGPLNEAGMSWLFFAMMTGISIALGTFGSVFNTYSGLYLSKDNDLLLSMPIPVKYIIASRILNVLILGTEYSYVAALPSLIVYLVVTGITAAKALCGILLLLIIPAVVLMLSCILGWCVAKISLKIRKKSFVSVVASLAFIGIYYFVYFKAQELLRDLIENASVYGEKIKGRAYIIYLIGDAGAGNLKACAAVTAAVAVLLLVCWLLLKNTFLSIATASGKTDRVKYKEKKTAQKSVFSALLRKEFSRFTSSANYMLNCGLGVLFIPVAGIALLIKGDYLTELLGSVFGEITGCVEILFCAIIFTLCSMIDTAAPSVSLEGKSIWVLQSLPVKPRDILLAKTSVELILTGVPVIFTTVCGMIVLPSEFAVKVLLCCLSLIFIVFSSHFSAFLGISMPNLTWTNEIMPIKQSGNVAIAICGTWGITAVFAVVYFLAAYKIGVVAYLSIWTAVLAAATVFLARYIYTKGAKIFAEL